MSTTIPQSTAAPSPSSPSPSVTSPSPSPSPSSSPSPTPTPSPVTVHRRPHPHPHPQPRLHLHLATLSSSPSPSPSSSPLPTSESTPVTSASSPSPQPSSSTATPPRTSPTSSSPSPTPTSSSSYLQLIPHSPSSSSSTPQPTSTTSSVDSTSSSRSSSSSSATSDSTSSRSPSNGPTTTFSSTVFIQTTNSLGQPTSIAPPEITSTFTSTLSNGGVVTFTEVVANPTLSPNRGSNSSSQFFHNKGAVAGVFLIVGLAAASICLWIFFFIRRRRRRRRIDHETAVSASLAAAGYNRAPIDDEEDFGPGPGMRERFNSMSSHPTISTPITEEERAAEAAATSATLYDPYTDFNRPVGAVAGFIPTRSDSPAQRGQDNSYSSGTSRPGTGHPPRYSTGSLDPLLVGMAAAPLGTPGPSVPPTPTLPPRSPRRPTAVHLQQSQENAAASTRNSERSSSPDDRLDPALASLHTDNTKSQELRDDVDYSRPVLEVRNRADSEKR
ncbi:hypothetical protein EDB92DRAFT_2112030 [Lactarius akahatsu]|uniref:Uncharacterized protein n=1 Tax=Lactarius akahatsu TaxID=416441 RepID=A0AAD4LNN9_9AGAM|nr:hypothetical protein EDB92DRAFT_2112030 [Lactarius akahatsu]